MDKKLNWIKINKNYKGLWVALDEKERGVVAVAKNAKEVYGKAIKKGIESPILFKVPEEALSYVG
ncbi:MAG: DUF5678 domain-containing protein [Patescibacteria group bacterium]